MNIHYVYYIQYIYNPYIVRIVLNPYTIRISAQSACYPVPDPIQKHDKILVLSQKFLYDVLPRVFCPCQKSQIITKFDFLHFPQKCKS